MAAKEIKLEEEAISEILVADTGSESGAEGRDVEDNFVEEEDEQQQHQQASAEVESQPAEVADYQPGDHFKEGTQIFILLSVQQKV
jgi:hypothetical protein